MTSPKASRSSPRPGAVVGIADEEPGKEDPALCTCCEPRNPLVMRPDLGLLGDGSPEFAICVLHEPEPLVYRNRGDGIYVQMPGFSLSPSGEILDGQGNVVARVAGDGYQRLTTVDDEEPPPGDRGGGPEPAGDRASQPRTVHVDLSQDDFYRNSGAPGAPRRGARNRNY